MKKTHIASACIVVAGCLLSACGGEGGSTTVKVDPKPASNAPKIDPPEQKIKNSMKANTAAPADAVTKPKPKPAPTGG